MLRLFEMLSLQGCIVTIDAIDAQESGPRRSKSSTPKVESARS